MGRIVLPVYTPYYIPNGNEVAVIETSRGTIRVQLAGKDAPVTAGNFIELAARGFYDKLKFHAHKPGSVVLGSSLDPQPASRLSIMTAERARAKNFFIMVPPM